MLTIIDRYLLREVFKTFFAIFVVILLFVVVQGYIRILQQAVAGALESRLVLQLVALQVIEVVGPITPPTFFFAVLYSLGKLYRDSEIIALSASGVSTLRLFRAYFMAAVPVVLVVAFLTMEVLPWSKKFKLDLIESQQQQRVELATSVAGRFNEYSRGDLVFFVESMSDDKTRLNNIFVQNRQNGKLGLITADEGHTYTDPQTGSQYVVLSHGRRYEGRPGQLDYIVGHFERYALRIDEGIRNQAKLSPHQMPTKQLLASDDLRLRAEWEFRLMLPVAVLVFTLISVPLSRSLPRQGIYGSLILALLLYALFFNLQAVSGAWMISGVTPAWLGRWWVHPAMLLITALVLLFRSPDALRRIWRRRGTPT